MKYVVGLLVVALSVSACATTSSRPAASAPRGTASLALPAHFRLNFVDAVIFPSGTVIPALGARPIGGLSAITPLATPGEYAAISDETVSPRLMRFRIAAQSDRLVVDPVDAHEISLPAVARTNGAATDFEGLACFTDGTCYLSSEGNQEREPRLAPSIVGYRDGSLVDRVSLPDRFRPVIAGPALKGVRRNEAFEAFVATSDGSRLVAVSETALVQDGDAPTPDAGSPARVLVLQRRGRRFVPGPEYIYPVDRVTLPDDYTQASGSNGVVEILPLEDGTFLTMERSFVYENAGARRGRNDILLYRVSFDGADDVSKVFSLARERPRGVRVVSKTRVLSLDELVPRLPASLASLDNFEGLTVGPRLANGDASLLLLSDDNFSKTQVTAFLLLRIVGQ